MPEEMNVQSRPDHGARVGMAQVERVRDSAEVSGHGGVQKRSGATDYRYEDDSKQVGNNVTLTLKSKDEY